MDGDCLSLPALTGCISAGASAAAAVAAPSSVTLTTVAGKQGYSVIYHNLQNDNQNEIFNIEPGADHFNQLPFVAVGAPIRLVFNSVQGGGDAATSFVTIVTTDNPAIAAVNPADGDPAGATITTEHCADGAILIVHDPAAGDQFTLNLRHERTNSGGSGIAYDDSFNILFSPP